MQDPHGVEGVALEGLDGRRIEGRTATGGAEGAVAHVPAGPAGDLRQLGIVELAEAKAVEFLVGGECHMVDVEVKAHADRIGRDQVIHVARLVELDLGIAGAGGQCAQHHRCPAALPADQLGDRIDLLGREGDDGGPARQARNLLFAREGQLRQTRPGHHVDAGHQRLDERPHGVGADQEGFVPPALVQKAVGEDMAPVEIARELHLVDCHEGRGRDPGASPRSSRSSSAAGPA